MAVWLKGGNGKLLYIGTRDSVYSIPVFETQAVLASQYITRTTHLLDKETMLNDAEKWRSWLKKLSLSDIPSCIRFITRAINLPDKETMLNDIEKWRSWLNELSPSAWLYHI